MAECAFSRETFEEAILYADISQVARSSAGPDLDSRVCDFEPARLDTIRQACEALTRRNADMAVLMDAQSSRNYADPRLLQLFKEDIYTKELPPKVKRHIADIALKSGFDNVAPQLYVCNALAVETHDDMWIEFAPALRVMQKSPNGSAQFTNVVAIIEQQLGRMMTQSKTLEGAQHVQKRMAAFVTRLCVAMDNPLYSKAVLASGLKQLLTNEESKRLKEISERLDPPVQLKWNNTYLDKMKNQTPSESFAGLHGVSPEMYFKGMLKRWENMITKEDYTTAVKEIQPVQQWATSSNDPKIREWLPSVNSMLIDAVLGPQLMGGANGGVNPEIIKQALQPETHRANFSILKRYALYILSIGQPESQPPLCTAYFNLATQTNDEQVGARASFLYFANACHNIKLTLPNMNLVLTETDDAQDAFILSLSQNLPNIVPLVTQMVFGLIWDPVGKGVETALEFMEGTKDLALYRVVGGVVAGLLNAFRKNTFSLRFYGLCTIFGDIEQTMNAWQRPSVDKLAELLVTGGASPLLGLLQTPYFNPQRLLVFLQQLYAKSVELTCDKPDTSFLFCAAETYFAGGRMEEAFRAYLDVLSHVTAHFSQRQALAEMMQLPTAMQFPLVRRLQECAALIKDDLAFVVLSQYTECGTYEAQYKALENVLSAEAVRAGGEDGHMGPLFEDLGDEKGVVSVIWDVQLLEYCVGTVSGFLILWVVHCVAVVRLT
ncbi:hypothetical protein HK104_001992 [Borealophlyctis nickersoniae]|nr:hypothetical protein HK104_001992 [Borealophlyctis nickersoniae]